MKLPLLTLSLFAVLLGSCGSADSPKDAATNKDTTAKRSAPTPPDWYKRFEGTVAGQPVVVNLHKRGDAIGGSYYYQKTQLPIALYNWSDTTKNDAQWLLSENVTTESPDDRQDASWIVTLIGDSLTGSWASAAGKTATISLHEAYGEQSVPLTLFYLADSARYVDSLSQPQATATIAALQPTRDMADAPRAFLEIAFREAIGCKGDSLDVKGCMRQSNDVSFRDWRKQMAEMEQEMDLRSVSNNHSSDYYQQVLYNDNGWLIVESMSSGYSGGAHGNYASTLLNLDWQSQQHWMLTDVFNKRDTAQLVPLLQASARKYFKVGQNASLGGYLFDSKIPVTGNFSVLPTGICFLYNPYEIAAYAAGQIYLYLPYEQLKPWLTPAFKERMKLN